MENGATELRLVIAKNLSELRKDKKWTQLELAERLNYTDKAISKWERGESIPDIVILKRIADLFGVTVDYLITEEHSEPIPEPVLNLPLHRLRRRKVITTLSVLLVWFVATLLFVVLITLPSVERGEWLTFVYGVPVSALVWLIFNSLWFNPRNNYWMISALMWGICCAAHLTVLVMVGYSFWLVYILAIPGQAGIILWSIMGKKAKAVPVVDAVEEKDGE